MFFNFKVLVLLAFVPAMSFADFPSSFNNAKTKAERDVYDEHPVTFYCGCDFVFEDVDDIDGNGKTNDTAIIRESCGYTPRDPLNSKGNPKVQTQRIEWEHIVPASLFGGQLHQWLEPLEYEQCITSGGNVISGRECAQRTVPWFKKAHNDMHNLVPVIGELNLDRLNYPLTSIPNENREYGQCDFEVDFELDIAEPADSVKGDVARVYMYMMHEHNVMLDETTVLQMLLWSELDPVDQWECTRDQLIADSQGNNNPFVAAHCN